MELQEKKEKKAPPEKSVIKGKKAPEEIRAIKATKDQMEIRGKEAIKVKEVPPELLATPVRLEKEG